MSETGDGLDHLRIPYEKIKFGKKLETQGYGTVFEGEFDDQKVALKQLNITNLANIKPKLLAEILTISRFRQHPNLVALLGFCDEKSNEIILVYEFVSSGNLADKMIKRLTTIQRFEICLGAARGLEYLHAGVDDTTPGIVHGNVKLSKILLNSDANSSKFIAKVSSFGLSKIVPGKGQKVLESSEEGEEKPTKESDVYLFGVVLLEVLCGVSEIVDTDDYQERHVTELVPKKMRQNQLRKIVHRDIRKEIKEEALETYAKIACQCVVEDPDVRPTMARVVEELEKALRLQGGEVTYVQIPASRSIAGANDETVSKDNDDSGVTVESNIQGKEDVDVISRGTEEDLKDLIAGDKLDGAGEDNDDEGNMVGNVLESSNGEDTSMEGVPNNIHIEDAKIDSSNNPESDIDHLNALNSKKESDITVENKEEDTSKILIENADKEIITNDPETTDEPIDDLDSNNESKIIEENKEDDKSSKSSTSSESSSSDSSSSSDQEEQDSEILKSDNGNFSEVIEDEPEHLRIPLEKTTSSNVTEEESKMTEETTDDINLLGQSVPVPVSGSNDVESAPEDVQKENGESMNDLESTENIRVNVRSYEEPNIRGEDEVNNGSNITTSLKHYDGGYNNYGGEDEVNQFSMQGEKVSDAQLLANTNGNSLPEVIVGEDGQGGDDNGEMMSSNVTKEESKVIEDTTDDTALEGVLNGSLTENAKNESGNNDPATEEEKLNDLNSKEESNVNVETEVNTSKISISPKDPETSEEPINDFDSNKKSNIIEENKEYDESMRSTTTSQSSNGDTTTSTNQEVQDSEILKSDSGNFSEVNEDELKHLRIPFEEIKFGKQLDIRGYGTLFEGEYNHQQVALKRLNITNLGNIKPKLLSAILTISRFRQHPNLVALIGFCDESNKEIILVYEYVSGGNLADKMSKHLTTIQRLQICLGAARGLEYLHSGIESVDSKPGIIHGHLKLSKILLKLNSDSSEFQAKVSGFGLPKLLPGHVEIAPKSMDPVHAVTGKLTKESDVYSFGVLLLEVLCGVPELVDTDDYQERHVTELVPKRLEQNVLRKIVHFDIREEITTESLETYAKIACRCVMKNPEERPTMSEVVEELEKALRLQGGKLSDVQIFGINNGTIVPEVPMGEDDHEGGDSAKTMNSNVTEEESEVTEEATDDIALASVLNRTLTENAKNESSNNDPATEEEKLNDLNSKEESNVTVETEENSSKIPIRTKGPETSEEPINDFDSNKKSNIIEENKEYDESMRSTTASKSSNGDTTTSTNQEVQDSEILKSDSGNFSEVNEDELKHLRIPFEEIKFGKHIDVRGYGTLFEGEFNHRQVALKRLNITNLGNIKPKLLSAILTISRFRQHPNLVALIGFCDESNKEIILVYEYVSGGNLADKMSKHLTTIQRLQICLGAARGLEYLHNGIESVDSKPGIIHGHLKLSKILLKLNSDSSEFQAKVSGFGLPKLLPGHVEIAPKSMDPMHAVTRKLTKESDVYTFGVLLLEVLCGVPELVDIDDYQERHVTELVPKRLEQNMLRKIVHFDIREEITTESLETYAKIACRCVMKNPEERPTMSEVVEELEKALRLQGGKLSDVQIFGINNGTSVPEVPVGEDGHEGHDYGETINSNAMEKESVVTEEAIDDINLQEKSFPVPTLDSDDTESVPKDAEKENGDILNDLDSNGKNLPEVPVGEDDKKGDDNGETLTSNITEEESKVTEETTDDITLDDAEKEKGDSMNVHESTEDFTVDVKSNEESKIIEESEVNNEIKITTSSPNAVMQEDDTKEKDDVLTMNTYNHHIEEITEVQNFVIPDGNSKAELLNAEKPELIVNTREDFSYSATQTQNFKSKRSNSTSSESSNGDDTAPSDHLLPKSPDNLKKTSRGSGNCSCCCCSWWQFIYDRIVLYGEQFWNKLVSIFNWITGQCYSKRD